MNNIKDEDDMKSKNRLTSASHDDHIVQKDCEENTARGKYDHRNVKCDLEWNRNVLKQRVETDPLTFVSVKCEVEAAMDDVKCDPDRDVVTTKWDEDVIPPLTFVSVKNEVEDCRKFENEQADYEEDMWNPVEDQWNFSPHKTDTNVEITVKEHEIRTKSVMQGDCTNSVNESNSDKQCVITEEECAPGSAYGCAPVVGLEPSGVDSEVRGCEPQDKPFRCEVCSKQFAQRRHLVSHAVSHSAEKPLRCSVCDKCFLRRSDLIRHTRTHSRERPFKCLVCSKCFLRHSDLTLHSRTHSGDKPYKCPMCSKSFAQHGHLKSHVNLHTGDKPHRCAVCNKCFVQRGQLNIHARTHTGDKLFKCPVCSKCFAHRSSLVTHTRVHTGDKPYECKFCNKRFAHRRSLIVHTRTHSGEKPFKCDVCSRCFAHRNNLVIHTRNHCGKCGVEPRSHAN